MTRCIYHKTLYYRDRPVKYHCWQHAQHSSVYCYQHDPDTLGQRLLIARENGRKRRGKKWKETHET